jgi:predicted RNA-binding Zn-ribbon protein involved in translation (DUF1610 family)
MPATLHARSTPLPPDGTDIRIGNEVSAVTTKLPVHCPQCGVALKLQLVDWDPSVTPTPQIYRCPMCQARHTVHPPGRIAAVFQGVNGVADRAESR